jgi:NAD(P)-dependent dehydrogenase (short-subunit alcohol dehydrogenase family)
MTQDNTGINSLLDLANKRAIATGTAQGLGFAISRRLSEAGAAVLMVDTNEAVVEKPLPN